MPALQVRQLAPDLLALAAEARHIGAQQLDLVLQVEQAAPHLGVFFGAAAQQFVLAVQQPLQTHIGRLARGFDALAQIENRLARLLVVEQAGVGCRLPQAGCQHRHPDPAWLQPMARTRVHR